MDILLFDNKSDLILQANKSVELQAGMADSFSRSYFFRTLILELSQPR
jgi:hypothetical protein